MQQKLHNILIAIRDFLFGTFNREFLIFLFFLVLSSVYWLMSVLNDTMEREITLSVQLVGVPKNVIIIGDSAINVRVTVKDKGYAIATYIYGDKLKPISVPFSVYARSSDELSITNTELQKMVRDQLYGSSRVIAVKPDHLKIPFNMGMRKLVPVKLLGKIDTSDNFYLARVEFQPESVYVYASKKQLENIVNVYTIRQNLENVSDTITRTVALKRINGVKIVPTEVKMTMFTDIMTEAVTNVNITSINVPPNYVLRTFPSQVQVRYIIGASQFKKINENDFSVVADYMSTNEGTTEKCPIRIVKSPKEARNPMLSVSEVDYLIEQ